MLKWIDKYKVNYLWAWGSVSQEIDIDMYVTVIT